MAIILPWDREAANLTRRNVQSVFPCFTHFDKMHCYNLGIVGTCPYERLCKKEKEIEDLKRKEYLNFYQGGDKEIRKMLKEAALIKKRRQIQQERLKEEYEEFANKIYIKRK
jgi:hypothetical protein